MQSYKVKIEPEAFLDIQQITNWYDNRQAGLGDRFKNTTIKQIDSLRKDPQIYAIRYNEIRCMIIQKFPYMIHYFINENASTVEVMAVISTSRNPKIWEEKTKKT
jgi:hypothetical protein